MIIINYLVYALLSSLKLCFVPFSSAFGSELAHAFIPGCKYNLYETLSWRIAPKQRKQALETLVQAKNKKK